MAGDRLPDGQRARWIDARGGEREGAVRSGSLATRLLLPPLAALRGTGFYLAGGTALASRLGHRESVDLDFFLLDLEDVEHLKATLSGVLPDLVVTLAAPRTLRALASAMQISLFDYRYPALMSPDEPTPGLLPLAGVADIPATRLAAIASGGSHMGLVNLWFILDQGTSLDQALARISHRGSLRAAGDADDGERAEG